MPRKLSVSVYVNVGGTRFTTLRYSPTEVLKVRGSRVGALAQIQRAVRLAAVFADRVNTETK